MLHEDGFGPFDFKTTWLQANISQDSSETPSFRNSIAEMLLLRALPASLRSSMLGLGADIMSTNRRKISHL